MPLGTPPDRITMLGFPLRRLAGTHLCRVYRPIDPVTGEPRGAWWFASAPTDPTAGGRYDLRAPAGAAYWARLPAGAVLERFQSTTLIDRRDVAAHQLAEVTVPDDAPPAADLAAPAARGFGVTGEIHSIGSRPATRAWAEALYDADWRLLAGLIRHDPSQAEESVTLLDDAGAHSPSPGTWPADPRSRPLSDVDGLANALAAFGVEIVPGPFDPRFVTLDDSGLLDG